MVGCVFRTVSAHRTSVGWVRYQRCVCRRLRIVVGSDVVKTAGSDGGARPVASAAAGVAMVLAESDPSRLGRCAAPGCRTVFVDVSRAGRRRYCTPACATRVNVAAHRARSRFPGGAPR